MDFMRVLVNKSLAQNEGLDEQRALTLGIVGALVGPPVMGYALTIATARREAPPPRKPAEDEDGDNPPG